ncbi:hypothetical protein M758_11G122100 [Ceratodon purpureus]|nr:hypothetical protein M758_11G122100 [Ceratodon purpureus]
MSSLPLISSCFCCRRAEPRNRQLPPIRSVQAVLFDIDGTLADSDPLHYLAFREMLAEIGYNCGNPITKEFYSSSLSGKHNSVVGKFLFPDWDQQRRDQFLDDKEAHFRRLAAKQLEPVAGLHRLTDWIKQKGFHRAAVTNAPRASAEQMIAGVGLTEFFEHVVIGGECERAKPFPDPYLKALEHFGVSAQNAFAFEGWGQQWQLDCRS